MTDLETGPTLSPAAPAFAVAAGETLQALRTAVLNLFESRPGGIGRSRDAQRQFGVNAKLSWQLFRLAAPGDPLTLAPHVPAPSAMRSVFAAAAARGSPPEFVEQLATAYRDFEDLVALHAGDRATFDSMTRSVATPDADRGDLQHRRNMFRACSHYWGLQIDTYFTFGILHPSATAGLFDYANVRYKLGLRRLREDASAIVDSFKVVVDDGASPRRPGREPIDAAAADLYGAPLLPALCSQPLPLLRTHSDPDGTSYSELISPTIGRRGAADVAFGEVSRASPLSTGSTGRGHGFGANVVVSSPTATLISDMLVHRPTLPNLRPFLKVYGSCTGGGPDGRHTATQLPFTESVRRLDLTEAAGKDLPNYVRIVTDITARLGWRIEELDVYRVKIDYPLMHTRAAMGFDLPDAW